MTNVLLNATNISKSYHDAEHNLTVLKNISIQIERAQTVAFVGASGSGKSTLLHILGTLDQPDSGSLLFNGNELIGLSKIKQAQFRNKELGFVYQFHHLLPEFTAIENVAMPLLIGGINKKLALEKSAMLLEKVGLADRAKHQPNRLSGGERQRVAIARSLVNDPSLILADEPTGNLDSKTSMVIYELITKINDDLGTAFVLVTHNNELAQNMDVSYTLNAGVLALSNTTSEAK